MPSESEIPQNLDSQKLEKAKDKRAKTYIDVIDRARPDDSEIRRRQETILRELPDLNRFAKLMEAAFKAHTHEDVNLPDKLILQGIIFEELVKIENSMYNFASQSSEPIPLRQNYFDLFTGKIKPDPEDKLVSFVNNPKRFGYGQLSGLRNQDLSYYEKDKNGVILEVLGAGEAKSSYLLDSRCLSQLESFRENTEAVAEFLNKRKDSESHGLEEFGQNGNDKIYLKVKNEKDFKKYLIVTRDMRIDPNNPRGAFKMHGDRSLSAEEVERFENLIKKGSVQIRRSSFSHEELDLLVDKILPIIQENIATEVAEYHAEQESK